MIYGKCLATVTCTYSPALSKNARLKRSFRGRMYIAPAAKIAEAKLEKELKTALKNVNFYTNKIYLDCVVFKTRTNTDSINFIDGVADCLKRVILVDDRYFCIKNWDYEVDRVNPRIVLRLFQPDRRNV